MKNKNNYDLAIIGGGAQATAFISAINNYFKNKNYGKTVNILIIDKKNNFGCGKVYNKDFPWILMNTPTTDLSIIKEDQNDFKNWVELNYNKFELDNKQLEYLPRSVFGYYLKEKLDLFIENLKTKNIFISKKELLAKEVNILKQDQKIKIILENGEEVISSYLLLAKGHDDFKDPYHLKGSKNYIHMPFPAKEQITEIPKDSVIGIIGSNLTAIDIAITLKELGHNKIFMFSRSGKLPEVKGKFLKSEKTKFVSFENFTNEMKKNKRLLTIKDILKSVRKELFLHNIDWRHFFFKNSKSYDEEKDFISRIEAARNEATSFNIILGMIPEIAKTWRIVEPKEVNKFMSLFYNKIHQKHGAIPLINAEKIASMLKNKELTLKKDLVNIQKNTKYFEVKLINKQYDCDFIINASGPNRKVCITETHILKNICAENNLKEIDLGGTITDVKTGKILKSDGLYLETILAIGHNAEGSHPFINNFAWILETTDEVALSFINEVLYGKI